MIKGEHAKLTEIAKFNVCAEHQADLEVAWNDKEAIYVLRCGHDHYPDAVMHKPSLTDLFKQGKELPEPIKSNVEKGLKKRAMQQAGISGTPSELGLVATDLGSNAILTKDMVDLLIAYASRYGLDAYRGHVVLMYSKPYITIDGYLWHARQTNIPYTLRSRPMTRDEMLAYKVGPDDHAWVSEVMLITTGEYYIGMGIVTQAELTEPSKRDPTELRAPVVAKHPQIMAQKRAEWQALRRAFPIGSE